MTAEAVIEELLAYEQARANLSGFSDCTCINHSRETERAYEYGQCPHQKARAALKCSSTGLQRLCDAAAREINELRDALKEIAAIEDKEARVIAVAALSRS
jgi:hypothetical protein